MIELTWHDGTVAASALATFFAENVDPSYISHSELLQGLAASPTEWASDLAERVREDLDSCREDPFEEPGDFGLLLGHTGGELVLLAVVAVHPPSGTAHLHDLVVAREHRGRGHGSAVVELVKSEAARRGLARVMLESGASNARAHEFFERHGFERVSSVFVCTP